MKIIFLDIDGVLNSDKYDKVRDWNKMSFIDESRLALLKQIVDKTGAAIVLISTWRKHWDKNKSLCDSSGLYICEMFEKYGLSIYDKTPYLGIMAERRNEIKDWLQYMEEKIESFVIIDDYPFGWEELNDYYIKTEPNFRDGLEIEHVEKAIDLLNNIN